MTVLTDTQVVTASGGLVELGYSQITSPVNVTSTSFSSPTTVIAPLTVVCDGSPVLVEFFASHISAAGTGTNMALPLYQDGAELDRFWGYTNTVTAVLDYKPVHLQRRVTPSAGVHTFGVMGQVAGGTGEVRAGTGGTTTVSPAFLRVSKIVQATQWPAVTTGSIICTSSTRPASPFAGQQIYETDTSKSLIYNGTAWVSPQAQTVPPMCKATKNAVQSIPTSAATVITFQTEDYDTDSMHSTATNTSRITIGTAGVYTVTGFVLSAASVAAFNYLYIFKNGAALPSNTGILAGSKDGGNAIITQITVTLSLAAADYVELAFYHNNTGAINVSADCWLSAHFLGKTA